MNEKKAKATQEMTRVSQANSSTGPSIPCQQREDGYSSVGVPPSEVFEGLAKSYHGWVPRNAKARITPKYCPR